MQQQIQCTEVWGGTGSCDVSVKLAGVRGECYSKTFEGGAAGGDIHFLSVCGMSILSKIVIADVSGHGEESAAVSSIIHDALIESIGAHDNSAMMTQVNNSFVERRTGAFKFTTMVSLIFDSRDRSLVYAYAGHPSILCGSPKTGRFSPIRPEGQRAGLPLGILHGPEISYEQHLAQLERGEVLVVYTDAFSEAIVDGAMIGEEGLVRILEGAGTLAPDLLKAHLIETVGTNFNDDASLLILEVL